MSIVVSIRLKVPMTSYLLLCNSEGNSRLSFSKGGRSRRL